MYESFYELNEKPFKNTPDTRYLFKSQEHEEALVKMFYAIEQDMGGAVLTGVFGCGKTVVSQVLYNQLPVECYQVVYINNPQLDYIDLLRSIVRKLKVVELPMKKTDLSADALLEILEEILMNNSRDGKKTVIIIDEAHIIKDPVMFESLRLLLNFQQEGSFLLSLLLFGQPELRQNIQNNKQFEQRIAIKCHLGPFDLKTTTDYVNHRLSVAGAKTEILNSPAVEKIFELSNGIPRRINRLADLSLLVGYGRQSKLIDADMVEEASKMMSY